MIDTQARQDRHEHARGSFGGVLSPALCLRAPAALATAAVLATIVALLSAAAAHASVFASEPTLEPPPIAFPVPPSATTVQTGQTTQGSGSAGKTQPTYLMLAPIQAFSRKASFVGKAGPEIVEPDGNLVWQLPLGEERQIGATKYKIVAMDLHTSTYQGKPVLVWWQGYITPQGFGDGVWEIDNQQYQKIATIKPPNGYELDFHDIEITSNGMAYVLGNKTVKIGLSCCGGPVHGEIYDQVVFQVNIATGKIVWEWNALAHIRLRDSYTTPPPRKPWDPYHLNSISIGPSGNVILSSRNTWAAYWIVRSRKDNKKIFATLGGKASSFKLGTGVHFAWQHDVVNQPGGVSVFDDEAAPVEGKQSRGLLLSLNFKERSASLVHEYLLHEPALAGSQGSVQLEPDGNVFVGWGQLPYFSEYSSSGTLLYEGSFTGADESYRAYRSPWVGLPKTQPSLALAPGASGALEALASWNGATQVVSWQLLAGASATTLAPAGSPVPKTSFQTAIAVSSPGPYYAVRAISREGRPLGTSTAVQASG
ncbi:MAG: arylsulfotransferase family protein [Solirubrobacteraceae bacterium]